ncbi:LytR/AlgR family response regulator transcription factor [Niabella aquatica]
MPRKPVLIIDDEEHGRTLVKQYLQPYDQFFVAGECVNGPEAIRSINQMEPDLVFLDIQMPGANGFEVLQQIEHVPQVIFTTAYDKYAIQAFEANAVDYLLKPYTKERFERTMFRLEQQTPHQSLAAAGTYQKQTVFSNRILVEHNKRFRNIATDDILFLKANGDHTEIHTFGSSYLSSAGISALSSKFDQQKFVRVHRSIVVNMSYVREVYKDIGKTFLVMENGIEFNVGRNYLPLIKNLMV